MQAPKIPLVVCADDYGIAPGVNRAILEVLEQGSISATSCMTLFPEWETSAAALKPYVGKADIGLHLVLTDFPALTAGPMPSFAALARRCYSGYYSRDYFRKEFNAQLDRFVSELGSLPSHIDGHQHVHLLPVAREALIDMYRDRLRGSGCYIRNCHESLQRFWARRALAIKPLSLSWLGKKLHRMLEAGQIPHNDSFAGVYEFDADHYEGYFPRFLAHPGKRPLMLCHPGHVDAILTARDSLLSPRETEAAFFSGEKYRALLEKHGMYVSRFSAA